MPEESSSYAGGGREEGGSPGAVRWLVGNGEFDRADPVLDRGVDPVNDGAGLARRGPGLHVGGTKWKRIRTRVIGGEFTREKWRSAAWPPRGAVRIPASAGCLRADLGGKGRAGEHGVGFTVEESNSGKWCQAVEDDRISSDRRGRGQETRGVSVGSGGLWSMRGGRTAPWRVSNWR